MPAVALAADTLKLQTNMDKNENTVEGFKTWAMTVLYGFGALGSFLYPLVTGQYLIAAGALIVAVMAFPFIKSYWK